MNLRSFSFSWQTHPVVLFHGRVHAGIIIMYCTVHVAQGGDFQTEEEDLVVVDFERGITMKNYRTEILTVVKKLLGRKQQNARKARREGATSID